MSLSFSMMQLVGHQKNIILKTTNIVVVISRVDMSQAKQILQLHNLASFGMKPPVIIMMLLLVSIMTEIQVSNLVIVLL